MKKKGLIISTVVMVVVLIASLTTATYAWFSVSASASIEQISIATKASDGLVIASYDPTAQTTAYYSGDVAATDCEVASKGKFWGSAEENGFGTSLNFTVAEGQTQQIADLFAASGDGINMFMNAADQQVLKNSKPENVKEAQANINYFVLDFVLQSTSAVNGNLFIKQLNINPSSTKANMAGSVRIAVFAKDQSATPTAATSWTVADDGLFVYDPFGYQTLANGVWKTGNDLDTMKYVTQAGAYNDSLSTAGAFKTLWTGKYLMAKEQTVGVPSAREYGGAQGFADADTARAASAFFDLGTMNAGYFKTFRVVMWFEGEDSACVEATAGGGIDLTINFGLKVAEAE